jgi:hypothetical protein
MCCCGLPIPRDFDWARVAGLREHYQPDRLADRSHPSLARPPGKTAKGDSYNHGAREKKG